MNSDPRSAGVLQVKTKERISWHELQPNALIMEKTRGTYILALRVTTQRELEVGKLGTISFEPGVYLYVGSALGPGGLAARLGRHMARTVKRYWHIDYLLDAADLLGALGRGDGRRRECEWAAWLFERGTSCIQSFGCSDCPCSSHLFFVGGDDSLGHVTKAVQQELGARRLP